LAVGENELEFVINKANCGFVAEPDNPEALKEIILKFMDCKNKKELSKNSRKFYEENFAKDLFFNKLEKIIEEV
jgi:glycosyltransferase involved in cell wall biosynthesis